MKIDANLERPGRRVLVVGTSGTGKTTLACELGRRFDLAHYELDALHWGPNWTSTPFEALRPLVDAATLGDAWVIDGNYSATQDMTSARADTIVWLDYALPITMWQLMRRTLQRVITQEELWAGNRESLRTTFLSRDSILLYALQSYRRRRKQYAKMMIDPAFNHVRFIRLKSPQATRSWLDSI